MRSCRRSSKRWGAATAEPESGVVVRRGQPSDVDGLLALEAAFPTDRLSRASLRHLLTRAHADVWVAEAEGRAIGDAVVLYRRGYDTARLYSLVVADDHRGRGIGAALLAAAEEGASQHGSVGLRLEVRADNVAARRLYERSGYVSGGSEKGYYGDGGDALRMRKRLRGTAPELLPVPFVAQTLPFSCGPACLMMAMRTFVSMPSASRAEEIALWRDATTVYLAAGHGGCSPHGLAVAATRRGFAVEVYARDASIPFLDSVRSQQKKEVIEVAHRSFLAELASAGVPVRRDPVGLPTILRALARGHVPILLVSSYRLYREKVPHWVVVTGADDEHLYVHDPFVSAQVEHADGVHLPLPRSEAEAIATFGKARHRYLVVVGPPVARSDTVDGSSSALGG